MSGPRFALLALSLPFLPFVIVLALAASARQFKETLPGHFLLYQISVLCGSLIVLAWVDWRMMLGGLLLIPAVYVSHRTWINRIRPLYRDIRTDAGPNSPLCRHARGPRNRGPPADPEATPFGASGRVGGRGHSVTARNSTVDTVPSPGTPEG
jgi:hypothetical protein